jgi:hypothetical protein
LQGTKVPDAAQRVVNTPVAVKRRFTDKLSTPAKCRRINDPNQGKILQHKLVLTSGAGKEGFSRLNDIGIADVSSGSRFRGRISMGAPQDVASRNLYLSAMESNMRKVGVSYGTGSTDSSQDVATVVQGLVPIEASSGSDRRIEPFTKVKWQFPRPKQSVKADFFAENIEHGCFAQDPDGIYPQLVRADTTGVQDAENLMAGVETWLATRNDVSALYTPPDADALCKLLIGNASRPHYYFFDNLVKTLVFSIKYGNDAVISADGEIRKKNPLDAPERGLFLAGAVNLPVECQPVYEREEVSIGVVRVTVMGTPLSTRAIGYEALGGAVDRGRQFMGALHIARAIVDYLEDHPSAKRSVAYFGYSGRKEAGLDSVAHLRREFANWVASIMIASAGLSSCSHARIVGTVMKDDGKGSMTILLDP